MGSRGCHAGPAGGLGGARASARSAAVPCGAWPASPGASLGCGAWPAARRALLGDQDPGHGWGGQAPAREAGLECSAHPPSQRGGSEIDPGRKKRSETKRGRLLCQAGRSANWGPGERCPEPAGTRIQGRSRDSRAWHRGDEQRVLKELL